jgi:transposase InsO family protein
MMIALHKNARTTPAIRAEIASSGDSAAALAQRFGITEATVYKWKKRTSVHDASHTPHRLQTTLTPTQERVVVELRRTLLLPLDDLLAVTREFICPNATRSGLDRCLRRHGVGNLGELKPAQPAPVSKTFKAYEPGYLHIDLKYLPQMQDESSRRYLFVAIDRATRWVFVQIKKNKTAASAKAFLNAVHKACPMRIQKVLTDNGKEFTDRLFASRARQPTGEHEFDQLCASLGIEHRLTKPRTPRTNGMVERFNGRIADVLRSHRFNSGEDLEQTLLRYAALYNHQFPQSALKSRTPLQAMKDWYAKRPDLFVKRPYDHPGCDTYLYVCRIRTTYIQKLAYMHRGSLGVPGSLPFLLQWQRSAASAALASARSSSNMAAIRAAPSGVNRHTFTPPLFLLSIPLARSVSASRFMAA